MDSNSPPTDPLSTFALSVFSIYGLLMRSGENVTRPFGQTSARWQVLGRVGYQSQTVAQMAHDMGSSRQSVQYVTNRLLKENLLALKDNPTDRRTKLVEITPKGAEVLAAIYERDQEWSGHIMAKLDPRQLEEITVELNNIARIFESHLDSANKESNE